MNEEEQARLDVDLDTRLTELWLLVSEPGTALARTLEDELVRDALGAVMRAAYGKGYADALDEDRAGRRAELQNTHGFRPG